MLGSYIIIKKVIVNITLKAKMLLLYVNLKVWSIHCEKCIVDPITRHCGQILHNVFFFHSFSFFLSF
jgi:hypothetical protein